MPYKYQGRIIRIGRGWQTADGVKHPATWNRWSDAEKTAAGLTWEADPQPYDNRFYWGRDAQGTLIEKALDDVNAVDEDGDPILDEDGVQVVTKGLKSNAIAQTKVVAGSLLASTDWYVTRKAETSAEIPADVLTYRQAVRDASNTIEGKIKAVKTLTGFKKLYDTPVDAEGNPTGNAPIADWPESN